MKLYLDRIPSPVGIILAVTDHEALRALDVDEYTSRMHPDAY